jgi:ubiquinone biosynthesis monooxygenase Coq7
MPKPYFKTSAEVIDEIIRVDHAGEYAAKVIYQTQIRNTRSDENKKVLQEMLEQEMEHLKFFNQQIVARKVRPTAFMPLWHFLSWGLGKASASLGSKHTMLATDAVEEVIQEHYKEQLEVLENFNEPELKEKITQFRQEEIHHQSVARNRLSNFSSSDSAFEKIIKAGCRIAIAISKRV